MIDFTPHPEIALSKSEFDPTRHKTFYRVNYDQLFEDIAKGVVPAIPAYRHVILNDLFFIVHFVMANPIANHPFVVKMCQMVEDGPQSDTLDVWARGHFKSMTITQSETLQFHLKYPDKCTGILAYARPAAKKFLRSIKILCENSDLLRSAFPDILWDKPEVQAPKWSLDINTPVLTTQGWKRHGDLQPGDRIFGSRGQVITVIGNSGPMDNTDCRRIVFDDCEIIASSEHLWPVHCKPLTGPWPEKPSVKIVDTDNLPIKNKRERLLPTPLVDSPQQPSTLITDPYILGLWLGNGTAGTNIISMHREDEPAILNQISEAGLDYYVHRKKQEDNFSMYGVKGLKESLTIIGCIKNKHIPERYLFGSIPERLALLQGLMDSDGTCKHLSNCAGMCMFSNTNENLARGVFHLAASFGLRPSIVSHMPKSRGRQRVYQVYFIGLKSIPPFRTQRKLDKCKEKRHKVGRYVRSIEKIPSVTVNCIKVDAPDSLYLAGKSLVVTHNSEDDGIVFKRQSAARGESTIEAWGLTEGMPTGRHFERLVFDDIETEDIANSPKMLNDVFSKFDMAQNLGTMRDTDIRRVIGTYYNHAGPVKRIGDLTYDDGRKIYTLRVIPASDDGTRDGNPVFEDPLTWEKSKQSKHFNSQKLCNPTPEEDILLDSTFLKPIDPEFLPRERFKFMVIDQAGGADTNKSKGDLWSIGVVSIMPSILEEKRLTVEDISISDCYLEDLIADQLTHSEAINAIVHMYLRHGLIMQLGAEKVGLSTTEIHIAEALSAKGRKLSVDHGNLFLLRPGGRSTEQRVESALQWPLCNGKLFYSTAIAPKYRDKMIAEMNNFPVFHVDILNMWAYAYDMFKEFRFSAYRKPQVQSVTKLMSARPIRGEFG